MGRIRKKLSAGYKSGLLAGVVMALVGAWFSYVFSGLRGQVVRFEEHQYKIFNLSDEALLNIKINIDSFRSQCKDRKLLLPSQVNDFQEKNRALGYKYLQSIHNAGFYYNPSIFQVASDFFLWHRSLDLNCDNLPSEKELDSRHDKVFETFSSYLYGDMMFSWIKP